MDRDDFITATVLSIYYHRGKLGAAYYSEQTAVAYILHDLSEDFEFRMLDSCRSLTFIYKTYKTILYIRYLQDEPKEVCGGKLNEYELIMAYSPSLVTITPDSVVAVTRDEGSWHAVYLCFCLIKEFKRH